MKRPNILWFCTDQQRFDTIRALGNTRIRTPHLDALVREGTSFLSAYCQSPVCTPSRASFLTGRYPRTTRCRQNGQAIPPDEKLISRMFADAGYVCGLAGKLHLAACSGGQVEKRTDDGYVTFDWSHHPQPDWPENAYSQWLTQHGTSWEELYQGPATPYVKMGVPAKFHQTTWCGERACEFMTEHSHEPWFLSVNCFDPHHPFDPPEEYFVRYDPDQMILPKVRRDEWLDKTRYQVLDHTWAHNEPGYFPVSQMTERDHREVTAAYYAMIELIDDQLGRMIQVLEETGQRERTMVIFMSDHGEMLGDHGLYMKGPHFYEAAVHVPLIVSCPGTLQAGKRCHELVELVDLVPTLLDLANLPIPGNVQGRSLHSILAGEVSGQKHRDQVFSEYYNAWTHPRSYGSMLRTKESKIIVYHGVDEGELYDLREDPDEFENLWNVASAASLKTQMMKRCFDASVFTLDPFPPRGGPF